MRVGDVRTSIKLEPEFWDYLREVADDRGERLSAIVNDVATASPDRTNLASTLRTYAIVHARNRAANLHEEVARLAVGGSNDDLIRLFDACPLPAVMIDPEREIRELNRSFALWLNLDPAATKGRKLDHIMILRGRGLTEAWNGLFIGKLPRIQFNATYVSPGKVRTAQAIGVPLNGSEGGVVGSVVLYETLAGRD